MNDSSTDTAATAPPACAPASADWATPARAMTSLVVAMQPAALDELRHQFPANRTLFDPTHVLGEGAEAGAGSDISGQSAMKALIETTIRVGNHGAATIIAALTERMHRVRIMRFAATLATTVAGALTAAPVMGAALPVPALLGPALALLGGILILVGEYIDKPFAGGQRSLGDLLAETLVAESTFSDVRLRLLSADLNREGALLELAMRASEAAAKLRHVSIFGGVPVAVEPRSAPQPP